MKRMWTCVSVLVLFSCLSAVAEDSIAFRDYRWGDPISSVPNIAMQRDGTDGAKIYRETSRAGNIVWASKPSLKAVAIEYTFKQEALWGVMLYFTESQQAELKSFLTNMYGKPSATRVDEGDTTLIWRRIGGGAKEVHFYSGNVAIGSPSGLIMKIYNQTAWQRYAKAAPNEQTTEGVTKAQRDAQALWQAEKTRQQKVQQETEEAKTTTYGVLTTLMGTGATGLGFLSLEVQQAEYDLVEYLVFDRYTDRLRVSLDKHFLPSPHEDSLVLDILETEEIDSQDSQ
ncbi:MAG: hypothetical protein HQ559_09115 [Lentisphaerae bacterium]|nr:hypothetical protein [Lentisphaerota bacterium]